MARSSCHLAVSCPQLLLGFSMPVHPGCFLLLLDTEFSHLKQHILPTVPHHSHWYPAHELTVSVPICITCSHPLVRSLLMSFFRKMSDSLLWLLAKPWSSQMVCESALSNLHFLCRWRRCPECVPVDLRSFTFPHPSTPMVAPFPISFQCTSQSLGPSHVGKHVGTTMESLWVSHMSRTGPGMQMTHSSANKLVPGFLRCVYAGRHSCFSSYDATAAHQHTEAHAGPQARSVTQAPVTQFKALAFYSLPASSPVLNSLQLTSFLPGSYSSFPFRS